MCVCVGGGGGSVPEPPKPPSSQAVGQYLPRNLVPMIWKELAKTLPGTARFWKGC